MDELQFGDKEDVITEIVGTLSRLNIVSVENLKSTKDIITNALYKYSLLCNSESTELTISADEEFYKLCQYYANKKYIGLVKENSINQVLFEVKQMYSFVNKSIKDITSEDIEMYFLHCRVDRKCKPTTLANKRSYLSSFFKCLVKNGKLLKDPIINIEPIKAKTRIKKPLSKTEITKLEDACTNSRDRALLIFMLETGVRAQELCNITINDIDYQKSEVLIRQGKGSKDRVVPFGEKAIFLLSKYFEDRKDVNVNGGEYKVDTPLFVSKRQPYTKLTVGAVERILETLGKKSNVTRVHPHLLRATYATNLAKQGVPINIISKLLGHADLSTINRYVLLDNADIRKALDNIM